MRRTKSLSAYLYDANDGINVVLPSTAASTQSYRSLVNDMAKMCFVPHSSLITRIFRISESKSSFDREGIWAELRVDDFVVLQSWISLLLDLLNERRKTTPN